MRAVKYVCRKRRKEKEERKWKKKMTTLYSLILALHFVEDAGFKLDDWTPMPRAHHFPTIRQRSEATQDIE
jgi:hypothetical protein